MQGFLKNETQTDIGNLCFHTQKEEINPTGEASLFSEGKFNFLHSVQE